jgi:hypothetical protein
LDAIFGTPRRQHDYVTQADHLSIFKSTEG